MNANPTLPFIDLPETRRPLETDNGLRSPTLATSAEPAPTSSRGPTPGERRQAVPRTVLRPRPLVPTSLDEALQLGRAVVAARLAPRGMETPEACMIAILHGLEVGLSPMQALQRIAVVNGRPTIWGDGALALVQASGLATSITEAVAGETPETWVASCTVLRRGERQTITRTFSAGDARRARLWGKAGPWSEYPQRMLQMRARAFALRDAFADVLGGLYLQEELADGEGTLSWQPIAVPDPAPVSGTAPAAETVQATTNDRHPQGEPAAQTDPFRSPAAPHESKVRRTAPLPPWVVSTSDASARHGSTIGDPVPQPVTSDDAAAEPSSGSEPRTPLPPLRPRSIDLRTRRPSATASRRRFNEHWDVRRPRALGEGKSKSIPTRRRPDPVVQDAGAGSPVQPEPTHSHELPASGHTTDEDNLTLLDDALCCALDQPTLDEIVEEFTDRIGRLTSEDSRKAEAIIRRHTARVASLVSAAQSKATGHE